MQKRRDKTAAKRCFKHALRSRPMPREIVTDQLRSYQAAKAEILRAREREERVRQRCGPTEHPLIEGYCHVIKSRVIEVKNIRNPVLFSKTIRHRMPGHGLPRFEGLRALGPLLLRVRVVAAVRE